MFYTAMELYQRCYAREHRRTPRAIVRLHNISFLHAYLCKKLFECPKTITRRKMFGRYFHSIVTHIPMIYRIASLRSVNAEKQERIFCQAKQITKATSSNRPQHVFLNIIQRLQIEQNKSPGVSKEERKLHNSRHAKQHGNFNPNHDNCSDPISGSPGTNQ